MKLLHLSDLHITANDQANEPLRQRFEFIARNYPDHFFLITGDVIDNEGAVVPGTQIPIPGGDPMAVLPTVFEMPPPPLGDITPHLFRAQAALQKALALLSLLPAGRVFLVPGNHDYGLWGNLYDEHYIRAFDDYLFTKLPRTTDGTFMVMANVLSSDLMAPRPYSARYPIHYLITAGGQPAVSILALNTVGDPTPDPTVLATGAVGGDQMTAIQNFLFPGSFMPNLGAALGICQICMFHHHPWIHTDPLMQLRDADQLLALLRNKIDLILFGHRHVERRYEPSNIQYGGFRFGAIAGGSSRLETGAYQIVINSVDNWTFNYVPIV